MKQYPIIHKATETNSMSISVYTLFIEIGWENILNMKPIAM